MDHAITLSLFLLITLHVFGAINGQKWGPSSSGKSYSKNGDGYDRCKAEGEPIKIPFCKGNSKRLYRIEISL